MSRYGTDPTRKRGQPDIVDYIKDISERVKTGEVGFRIGHTAIEDGDLVVLNGDIKVKESDGTAVLAILHGSVPEVRMYPLGDTDTHQVALFAFDFDVGFGPDQGVQLNVELVDAPPVLDGGKLLLTRSYAYLTHDPNDLNETSFWCNFDPEFPEVLLWTGRLRNQIQYNDRQTFYSGYFSASAGFSTWTHTYFTTWFDNIIPIVNVNYNGATLQWNLDSYTVSDFTVRFGTTALSKDITFFNVRVS